MARATPALGTPDIKPYACDVTSETGVQETFERIASDFGGRIDVLVTAAGIVDNVAAEEYALPRWKKMIDVNLHGTWLAAKEAGRYMLEAGGGGSIILVGSMSGQICVRPQKQAGYNAVCSYSCSPLLVLLRMGLMVVVESGGEYVGQVVGH